MLNSRRVGVLGAAVALLLGFWGSPACAGQATGAVAAAKAQAGVGGGVGTKETARGAEQALSETISFRFDIPKLVTNHQFEGQMNSFHVEYEYASGLAGPGFGAKGHDVPANIYPYFESVRDDIVKFAREYPDKWDFYEIFGVKICRFILGKYPQIRKITLTIDVPAYGEVDMDRSETVMVVRGKSLPK